MKKIVINKCFGGFGLSEKAKKKLIKLGVIDNKDNYANYIVDRSNPLLVKVVEEMGEKANGRYAKLKIVEIPDDVEWIIDEYDGMETVVEKHRCWS